MAQVIISLRVRLESPEVDIDTKTTEVKKVLEDAEFKIAETKVEPLAFGLKQLIFTISRDEDKGSTDEVEEQLKNLEGISSAEVVGVTRALG